MILFCIVPGLLALVSLLWVTNQIQNHKYAFILPWINLIIFIFMGNIFRKADVMESDGKLMLFIWCIGAGVTSFFTAIIIDFYLYYVQTEKIPIINHKQCYSMYFLSTLIPIDVYFLHWFVLSIYTWYLESAALFSLLLLVNIGVFVIVDKKLQCKLDRSFGKYIRLVIIILCGTKLKFTDSIVFHWYMSYCIIYLIRYTILIIKKNKAKFEENTWNIEVRDNKLLPYLPIAFGLISGILLHNI